MLGALTTGHTGIDTDLAPKLWQLVLATFHALASLLVRFCVGS